MSPSPFSRRIALSLALTLISGVAIAARVAEEYRVVPLGVSFPPLTPAARDVNDDLTVVGVIQGARGWRWTPGRGSEPLTSLGPVWRPLESTVPQALNRSGQVTGWVEWPSDGLGHIRAFRYTPGRGFESLNPASGDFRSYAYDLNDSGIVVGYTYNRFTSPSHRACYWLPGVSEPLLIPPPQGYTGSSTALGVNSLRVTVGGAIPVTGIAQGFRWRPGQATEVLRPLPGYVTSEATAVNDAGYAVGFSHDIWRGHRGTVWGPDGVPVDVGGSPTPGSVLRRVNASGLAVGTLFGRDYQAGGAWSAESGLVDLNDRLEPGSRGYTIRNASGVSDSGVIAGSAIRPDGVRDAVLLIPLD